MEMSAAAVSKDLITKLSHALDMAKTDVELLKFRVDRHDVLFRCIVLAPCDTQPYHATYNVSTDRNHASSLMTVEEVDADAMSRRDMYVEVGSCQRAATQAKIFFSETHTLMHPKIVRGVLHCFF